MILLVSDPFSDFLLKNKGTGNESVLVDRLSGVNSHKEFETVVAEWRDLGMHNDDSTLVIIKQDKSDELNIIEGCIDSIDKLIENEKIVAAEESFETNVSEVHPVTPGPDKEGSHEVETEGEDPQIYLSQLSDPQFKNHLESAVKASVKKYKKGKGGLEKKIPSLCRDIIDFIKEHFKK